MQHTTAMGNQAGRRGDWIAPALTVVAAASAPLVPFLNKRLPEGLALVFAVLIAAIGGIAAVMDKLEKRRHEEAAGDATQPGPPPEAPRPAEPGPAPDRPTTTYPRSRGRHVALAFGLAVMAIVIPLAAVPAVFFALRASRGGRPLAGGLAIAAAVLLGLVGAAIALNSFSPQPVPPPDTQETVVLNQYFTGLQQRCQAGQGPGQGPCQAAFSPLPVQQEMLRSHGWYDCRRRGQPPGECVRLLP